MPTIQTADLRVSARTLGAELSSIKSKDGTEYLWQADPAFWARQSPLLFPIVGALPNKTYTHKGKSYQLENHGFVKARDFTLAEEKPDSMRFELASDAESLLIYPFHFLLSVGYSVKDSSLSVDYSVQNTGKEPLYFSIGAHPAFRAPLAANEKREDFEISFEKPENLSRHFLTPDNVLSGDSEPFLKNESTFIVGSQVFERGAVVLKNPASRSITLKSRVSGRFVKMDFPGFPYLGIWSPKGDVPFVCLEPWHGVMPLAGSQPEIAQKEGIRSLEPNAVFRTKYTVTVG